MTRVRVESFTISLDGYGAGPDQDLTNPLGVGGTDLHQWLLPTRTVQQTLFGADGGSTGIDDDFAARGFKNVGAWILGRNMFSPMRGPWPDLDWKGWWGDNPPSRRCCWARESGCSRGRTCAVWDTNAFGSLRRRRPPMSYCGGKRAIKPEPVGARPTGARHPRRFRASPHSGPARREAVMRVRCYGDRRRC
jgi:dihydrofolate reductase